MTHNIIVLKKLEEKIFFRFWKFLLFFKVSGAAHSLGAKNLVNHEWGFRKKRNWTYFISYIKFLRGPLMFCKVCGIQKFYVLGEYHNFMVKKLLAHSSEKFRSSSVVLEVSGIDEFRAKQESSDFWTKYFMSRSTENFQWRHLLVFVIPAQACFIAIDCTCMLLNFMSGKEI